MKLLIVSGPASKVTIEAAAITITKKDRKSSFIPSDKRPEVSDVTLSNGVRVIPNLSLIDRSYSASGALVLNFVHKEDMYVEYAISLVNNNLKDSLTDMSLSSYFTHLFASQSIMIVL